MKRLPRLWCAMQGLLPIDACRAAELGELAWPRGLPTDERDERGRDDDGNRPLKHVAEGSGPVNVGPRGPV